MRLNTAQKLALNLDSHIVIDAGAGTGKTSTITDRVIEHYLTEDQRATRILPQPDRPSRLSGGMIPAPPSEQIDLQEWGGLLPAEVVLLTFTNRAADEMRDRLRKKILNLRPGPLGHDGQTRTDPRIRQEGFVEQLLTLLEDAPIGTIDSFLNQLVAPYRGKLGDALSRNNVSDSARVLITEKAMRAIWRLSSSPSRIGDAVDAGIPAHIAPQVLAARDRLAQHYSSHWAAMRVLRSLAGKSVFVDEAARELMDHSGEFSPDLLRQQIISSVDDKDIHRHTANVHASISEICELVRDNIAVLAIGGWPTDSRIASLDALDREGPPESTWEQLLWLSRVLVCTVSKSSLLSREMTFFPNKHFPLDSWTPGIRKFSEIQDKKTKERYSKELGEQISHLRELWRSKIGQLVLHFVRVAMLLDDPKPPRIPKDWQPPLKPLPIPLPERLEDNAEPKDFHLTIEAEIGNLQDLHMLHLGFRGLIKNFKEIEEVHDFDDIQRLAGDLLLANCPDVCRSFYPPNVQSALDSIGESTWRDDHIEAAFHALSEIESDPIGSGAYASDIGAVRRDLEYRQSVLRSIRRRYRAFIIDEAQDNSPLQWRILSRLWGERELREEEPVAPDTPWQPTVCYVGDVKQSIYAFRQAEVSGFREFARTLRGINAHEFNSIPELTRKPALRRESSSRDPRNDLTATIAKASEHMEKGGRDLVRWIPFDATDRHLPAPSATEVKNRGNGMISLQVNYRSQGGILNAMNEWWEDVLSEGYHQLPKGDFYAEPQILHPCPDKINSPGSIEWICPLSTGSPSNPITDLGAPIDPFGPGKPDSLERQALLIALRVRSLIESSPLRVRSADGSWHEVEADETIAPSDILILLPTRPKIRDIIVRHLQILGIPSQVDREGGLLQRPATHALHGLLQLAARPSSRHHATWVARSELIGFDDTQLHSFLDGADDGENLLRRLAECSDNPRQRSLVDRWCHLSNSSRIIDLLEESADFSDLLISHPDPVSRQDVEQFVNLVRELSVEVGGDPIVLADRVGELSERDPDSLEAETIPPGDAVRIMTIHSAKGLEAKVVILADLFSKRQTNLSNEYKDRLIVSPEFFGGNPNPWPSQGSPNSAVWSHAIMVHKARKIAEARRLLYVGATRAEERLIVVGSPRGTHWTEGSGISVKLDDDESTPQLGQMWLRSLTNASYRRGEPESPWIPPNSSNFLNLDPRKILSNPFMGENGVSGITVIHHPDCFHKSIEGAEVPLTTVSRIERTDELARLGTVQMEDQGPRSDGLARVRLSPSQLPVFQLCPRRHWLETRGGLSPQEVLPHTAATSSNGMPENVDSATFGTIFHRVLEIGIGNPGPGEGGPSKPLLPSWTLPREDRLLDEEIHETVFQELLPPGSDKEHTQRLVRIMAERIRKGPLGELVSGMEVGGHRLEGLRTEMPFHISLPVEMGDVSNCRWTPDGNEKLATTKSSIVELSGLVDLVICTRNDKGESTIRPVDLKTEDVANLESEEVSGLLEALGNSDLGPVCTSEEAILTKHRMQLALYYRALQLTEQKKASMGLPSREVLPPAILIGVTGRMIQYPEDALETALAELGTLLKRSSIMAISAEAPISESPRLDSEHSSVCEECPFHRGDIPFCGPSE